MKRILAIVAVAACLVAGPVKALRALDSAPVCPLGDAYEFAPELSDEFNGDELDDSKWWDFNPSWRGRKPALFSRENVRSRTVRSTLSPV